jgi:hypothetical protein
MQLDINSLLVGIVIGAAIAFITKMATLKSLSLKLDKLGIGLGVEGFDKKELPAGVTIGDISGSTTGDIAGRDVNKNSYMYQAMQAAAREAARIVLVESKSKTPDQAKLQMVIRFDAKIQQDEIVKSKSIPTRQFRGNEYYSEYFSSPSLLREIEQKEKELAKHGWKLTTIRPIDTTGNGLLLELVAEKSL